MSRYFQKPTGKKHDTAFADKWFAYLYGDSKAKEGVTYTKVFLDDYEKMKKKKKTKNKLNSKTVDRTPINVSTMGDDKPETDTSNLIQIGNQVGYPQESITYRQFQEKVRKAFSRRR